MMVYDCLNDIADCYDIFLFDAYGVFWEGNGFYSGSTEVMADLVKNGKTVVVISNSAEKEAETIEYYREKGLIRGKYYNYMITSGELLCKRIAAKKISFKSCKNPRKYYLIGREHKGFIGSVYRQVDDPQEADFIFCGTPYVFKDDVLKYPQYRELFWPTKADENGDIYAWNTETAKPFEETVTKLSKLNKPVLNANPDFTAKIGHSLVPGSEAVFVIRNGTIAEMFRQNGVEVYEFGKPYEEIYKYTFETLCGQGIKVDKKRTCMIGDTVRTDIKGALNVGITPILCVETGVTAEAILNGQSVKNLCIKEDIDLKQVVQIKSVGGSR